MCVCVPCPAHQLRSLLAIKNHHSPLSSCPSPPCHEKRQLRKAAERSRHLALNQTLCMRARGQYKWDVSSRSQRHSLVVVAFFFFRVGLFSRQTCLPATHHYPSACKQSKIRRRVPTMPFRPMKLPRSSRAQLALKLIDTMAEQVACSLPLGPSMKPLGWPKGPGLNGPRASQALDSPSLSPRFRR